MRKASGETTSICIGPDTQGFNRRLSKYCNEDEAYKAGKAEGRRLERRALRSMLRGYIKRNVLWLHTEGLLMKMRLAVRSKRGKVGK